MGKYSFPSVTWKGTYRTRLRHTLYTINALWNWLSLSEILHCVLNLIAFFSSVQTIHIHECKYYQLLMTSSKEIKSG